MMKSQVSKCARTLLSVLLAALIAQPPVALAEPPQAPRLYKPFSTISSIEEAQITIAAAEARIVPELLTQGADDDFTVLVQANFLTKLVDDPAGFLQYYRENKGQLMRESGPEINNWQLFLASSFMRYKLIKSESDPKTFGQWLDSAINSDLVKESSWKTWLALVGAFYLLRRVVGTTGRFVGGVAHGAMIAGPAAGSVNAFLNPLVTPINQWLAVKGIKWVGPLGMWINAMLWERKKKPGKESAAELTKAKEAVDQLRRMVEGEHYRMSSEQWQANRNALMGLWNKLQFMFGLMPDAYKFGRDRHVDLLVMRQRDFAQAAMNSVNAAEVQRQGAEMVLDRLISRGANAQAVQSASDNLLRLSEQLVQAEREAPERASELRLAVESVRVELVALGATAEQAERVVENYRNSFAFKRQGAAMLAAQVINDAMFAETIEGGRNLYEAMMRNTALNHLHGIFKAEVKDILEKLQFSIEIKETELKLDAQLEARQGQALERVTEINKGREGARTTTQPGSLTAEPPRTGAERVLEAVGRGRR